MVPAVWQQLRVRSLPHPLPSPRCHPPTWVEAGARHIQRNLSNADAHPASQRVQAGSQLGRQAGVGSGRGVPPPSHWQARRPTGVRAAVGVPHASTEPMAAARQLPASHPLVPRSPRPCKQGGTQAAAALGWMPGAAPGRASAGQQGQQGQPGPPASGPCTGPPPAPSTPGPHITHRPHAHQARASLTRMREPSVTTMICTLWLGQLRRICAAQGGAGSRWVGG